MILFMRQLQRYLYSFVFQEIFLCAIFVSLVKIKMKLKIQGIVVFILQAVGVVCNPYKLLACYFCCCVGLLLFLIVSNVVFMLRSIHSCHTVFDRVF